MLTLSKFIQKERELIEKATKGPWVGDEYEMLAPKSATLIPGNMRLVWSHDFTMRENDATFIANVRTSHAKLLEIVEILSEATEYYGNRMDSGGTARDAIAKAEGVLNDKA